MRKILLFTALFSLTFLLACGDSKEEVQEEQTFEITTEEKVDHDEVVMYLNGEEVTGDRYNLAYLQTKVQLFQLGQDVSDQEEIKQLALEALLEQELLQQDATEKGIEVAEEDVEEELSLIKSESQDSFDAFLEAYSFDESSYKMMLSFAMLYDKYIADQFPNIEVTDEEVEAAYDEIKSDNEEIAAFEDIKESLRSGLARQKESEKMQERIDSLKDKAEIETNI
ncbi:MAG TPA: SurA N-terminal domain-containing protein [Bacillota bacterium]|nr:SurA N-terminal domain-containing protein [Bacillota bacterium]